MNENLLNCACYNDLTKDKVFYDDYIKSAFLFLNSINIKESKDVILLCFENGWYTFGKNLKDELVDHGYGVIPFCLSSDVPYEKVTEKLLLSVENPLSLFVVGSSDLLMHAKKILKNTPACYFALDFDFGNFLTYSLKNADEKNAVVCDKNYLKNSKKNKISSGVKHVISSNMILVEMLVNSAIDTLSSQQNVKNIMNEARETLNYFFATRETDFLVDAIVLCSIAKSYGNYFDVVSSISKALLKQGDFCDRGESEYLAYKILVRLYRLYLFKKPDYLVRKGSFVLGRERAKELFCDEELVCKAEEISYSDEEIKELYDKISNSKELLKTLEDLENANEFYSEKLHEIYGGRKYTVEHYGKKQRIASLLTGCFLFEGFSLLKLIYSDGFLCCLE